VLAAGLQKCVLNSSSSSGPVNLQLAWLSLPLSRQQLLL
jgi:hypothetical protein